jgi:ABC-type glutathione transport system ATPase component
MHVITPSDATQILGAIAAYDQRTVGAFEANAWAASINHECPRMRLSDAIQAVIEWHATSADGRMKVSNVIAGARSVARRREAAEAAKRHAPGCYRIVDEFGQAAADQVRALESGQRQRPGPGLAAVHRVIQEIAEKRSMPDLDDAPLTESERIHRDALRQARADRRARDFGRRSA